MSTAREFVADRRIDFGNWEACKDASRRGYGVRFGELIDSQTIKQFRRHLDHRNQVVHVSATMPLVNRLGHADGPRSSRTKPFVERRWKTSRPSFARSTGQRWPSGHERPRAGHPTATAETKWSATSWPKVLSEPTHSLELVGDPADVVRVVTSEGWEPTSQGVLGRDAKSTRCARPPRSRSPARCSARCRTT
jgi:hypothetical protein